MYDLQYYTFAMNLNESETQAKGGISKIDQTNEYYTFAI
jgi:hypothetical protein